MNEISSVRRHALLRVLKKTLVHVRTLTSRATQRDQDDQVPPEMWKAANAALNAVHNVPDWLEGSAPLPFDEGFFADSLSHID